MSRRLSSRGEIEQPSPAVMTGDGRNVNRALGVLEGEGASIARGRPHAGDDETLDDIAAPPGASRTYYEQPAIKKSPWKAWIPAYFFVGGLSGAAAAFGAAAQIAGGKRLASVVVPARWLASAGLATSAVLLIADLGRPGRFLNMFRVFRPTSPMNVGTWILTVAATSAGASAVLPLLGARSLAGAAAIVAGASGLGLTSYTAVLVANTAVPAWQHGRHSLPALFTASAVASAGSALALLPGVRGGAATAVDRFALVGKLAELAAGLAYERELSSEGEPVVRHLVTGRAGVLHWTARSLTLASVVLSVVAPRSRKARLAWSLLALGGALATRFAVMAAGHSSSLDPRATFEPQRRRMRERGATARDRRSPREGESAIVPAC